ncbi:putative fbd-associated F-box protein [Abeliophyllum distichum]|uniref:Fbd-associated F-box protein n=1 Tax=Abeliophyllum distichum TaxID=126358 RepID=A0ABD1QGV7_9LAMI
MASSNKRCKISEDASIMPHLPDDIVEAILFFLPVKDLTKLSVLSKRFRHSWKFCKNLSFDKKFARWLSTPGFAYLVTKCLMDRNDEKIHRLHLYCDPLEILNQVRLWIDNALFLGVEELELDFTPSKEKFLLKSRLILAKNLKSFKVLVVKNCKDILKININAPKLRPSRNFHLLPHPKNVVIGLAYVRILTVSSTFLEGLAPRFEDGEFKELFFCLWNLKEFHLLVKKESFVNPYDVAVFLKRCIRIERVFIDLADYSFMKSLYWDLQGKKALHEGNIMLRYVKYVKIKGYMLEEMPSAMGRFFIKNARNLETLVLVKAKKYDYMRIDLPSFMRRGVTTNAKVEIYEYLKDKNTIFPQHL